MTNKANISVNLPISNLSEAEEYYRKSVNLRPLNLEKVLDWISNQDLSNEVMIKMKKAATKYPNHALNQFVKNYRKLLLKVQKEEKPVDIEVKYDSQEERIGRRPEGKFRKKSDKNENNTDIS